jgi:hypothetical protein
MIGINGTPFQLRLVLNLLRHLQYKGQERAMTTPVARSGPIKY